MDFNPNDNMFSYSNYRINNYKYYWDEKPDLSNYYNFNITKLINFKNNEIMLYSTKKWTYNDSDPKNELCSLKITLNHDDNIFSITQERFITLSKDN